MTLEYKQHITNEYGCESLYITPTRIGLPKIVVLCEEKWLYF